MNIGRHPVIAKRACENGIKVTRQHGEAVRWNRHSVGKIAVCAPIEVAQFDRRVRRLDRLHRLWNNFFADPVSGNNRDSFLVIHGRKGITAKHYSEQRVSTEAVLRIVADSSRPITWI